MKKVKKFLIAAAVLAVCIVIAAAEEFGPVYLSYGEDLGGGEGYELTDCILADEAYCEELDDKFDTTLVVMKDGSSLHFFPEEKYDDDFMEAIAEDDVVAIYYTLYTQIDPETAEPGTSVLLFRGNYYVETEEYARITERCSFTTDELFANGADLISTGGYFYGYYIMPESSVPEKPALETPWLRSSVDEDTGKIVLEWEAVEGAEEYEVYRGNSDGGIFTKVQTVSDTTWTDTSVEVGDLRYYRIRAVGGDKMSDFSRATSRWCILGRPVVTGTYNEENGEVVLTWDAIDGASGYQVYLYSANDGYYKSLATTEEAKFIHTSVEAGKTYRYKVTALYSDSFLSSYMSEEVSVACGEHVHTEEIIPGKDATCTETGLTEGKKCSDCGEILIEQEVIEVLGHDYDDGVVTKEPTTTEKGEKTYTCQREGCGYSYTEEIPELEELVLDAPTVKATNISSTGKIKLTWNRVDGAEKYEVWRSTSKNSGYKKLTTTTGTSITNSKNTNPGVTYYYKVRAIAGDVKSEFSEIVARTCDLAQPKVTVSNIASTGKIKLTWDKVDGAVKYEVWRATSKNGTYTKLITTTATSLTNSKINAGETYYYKVKAIAKSSAANSAYSEPVGRTCDLARPEVTVKLNSNGKPVVSWKAVSGAAKYEVWRSTSKNGTYTRITTTTKTSITNTKTESGVTYYYKVKAIAKSSAANSAYSAVASITAK